MAFAPLPPSTVELEGPYAHDFVHTRGIRLHVATAGESTQPLAVSYTHLRAHETTE